MSARIVSRSRYPDSDGHQVWTTENAQARSVGVGGRALAWKGGFIAVSVFNDVVAFWFRRPLQQEVSWAGDRNSAYVETDDGKLGPRNSFALWKEAVGDRCENFNEEDIVAARVFASAIAAALAKLPAPVSHAAMPSD
eukprot:tig00020943_g16303.t1